MQTKTYHLIPEYFEAIQVPQNPKREDLEAVREWISERYESMRPGKAVQLGSFIQTKEGGPGIDIIFPEMQLLTVKADQFVIFQKGNFGVVNSEQFFKIYKEAE